MPSSTSRDAPAIALDPKVLQGKFCSKHPAKSLRITCYGSSSSKTPEKYLKEARSLGYILAKRNHICVNGAGSYGCMAAMNDGVLAGNGHVVGVIHEMFLVDNGFWGVEGKIIRDGGAHKVFTHARKNHSISESSPAAATDDEGPIREILVARGKDLQERKKLLVQNCDAIVVMPGGPGTWDELWEMACARHLNLNDLPIVCVNVEGYYEPFRAMLQKAYEDDLIKMVPEDIVHFASSAEEAVSWIEEVRLERTAARSTAKERAGLRHKKSIIKGSSFFSASPYQDAKSSFSSMFSFMKSNDDESDVGLSILPWLQLGLTFAVGAAFGFLIGSYRQPNGK